MARLQLQSAVRNPLNTIFGVDANVAVLRELVRHGGALASAEIVARSGASKSSVRLGLIALAAFGLVTSEGTRTTRLHRFNRDNCLGPAIEALFQAEAQRYALILEAIREAAAGQTSEILSLCLYGSVAEGHDRPDSDLDILVVVGRSDIETVLQSVRENLREPAERLGFVPNVLGLSSADLERLKRERDPWWQGVEDNVVVLSGRHPDGLTRTKAG
ncbi:nucleotidyltransferase domain-containing protein [Rhizobium sp. G187]|uniref:nucleotidyltransferase domain-containing protein n=1 Tax=Rhizobium sp. G187 TaxID=3451352 RepID=UPI003EE6D724